MQNEIIKNRVTIKFLFDFLPTIIKFLSFISQLFYNYLKFSSKLFQIFTIFPQFTFTIRLFLRQELRQISRNFSAILTGIFTKL